MDVPDFVPEDWAKHEEDRENAREARKSFEAMYKLAYDKMSSVDQQAVDEMLKDQIVIPRRIFLETLDSEAKLLNAIASAVMSGLLPADPNILVEMAKTALSNETFYKVASGVENIKEKE